jgi:hypothetical protein
MLNHMTTDIISGGLDRRMRAVLHEELEANREQPPPLQFLKLLSPSPPKPRSRTDDQGLLHDHLREERKGMVR